MDITAAEERLLRVLCASYGPLGATPVGLAKALGITPNSVSTAAKSLERKGFCTRERVGMRIYLRPTQTGLAFVAPKPVVLPPPLTPPAVAAETQAPIALENLIDSQVDILAAVARARGPVTTSRLAELIGLTNRAVHRQASRLYSRGFLIRVREERRWLWALTTKGSAHAHVV